MIDCKGVLCRDFTRSNLCLHVSKRHVIPIPNELISDVSRMLFQRYKTHVWMNKSVKIITDNYDNF
jgi:hypothetical protein